MKHLRRRVVVYCGSNFRTNEDRIGDEARGDAMLQLTLPFDNEKPFLAAQTRLLLKRQQTLQFGILGRCDQFRGQSYSITAFISLNLLTMPVALVSCERVRVL